MLDSGAWIVPESNAFAVKQTTNAGRGVYASTPMAAGAHILTTSPKLSPTAYVILRPYRREVCGFCFAYDRGREWKIRPAKIGLAFCCQNCNERWVDQYGPVALQAHEVVETKIQQRLKRRADVEMQTNFYSSDEARVKWEHAVEVGTLLQNARCQTKPSKAQKQLLRQHADAPVDPDILSYLLSASLIAESPDTTTALMSLADNPAVYETASLDDYVRAYHLLLATMPMQLIGFIRADLCHEYVSRASHNAFSIRPTADGDHSGEFLGYGVWPEASFFNHSCAPNTKKVREGRQWSFSTARNVAEGEELCITYLGGEEQELNVQQRRARLSAEWGFLCSCERCLKEDASGTNPNDQG